MDSETIFSIAYLFTDYPKDTIRWDLVEESRKGLLDYLAENPTGEGMLYGVDTCFGPHAIYSLEDKIAIQQSLVNHLTVLDDSPQNFLTPRESRAVLAARIHVLGRGASGVRPDLILKLAEFLDQGNVPLVPVRGSLGASGDLIPLASIAKHLSDSGWEWEPKEAIAITNGTSFMSGLLAYQLAWVRNLTTVLGSALGFQVQTLPVFPSAFHSEVAEKSLSQGAVEVSQFLYPRLQPRAKISGEPIQDSYVIRAIPQIWGNYLDKLKALDEEITRELNSVSDNPVYSFREKKFLEGAGFYGSRISLLADEWNLNLVGFSVWLERMIQYLLDPRENENRLPLLLSPSPGKNAGMAGLGLLATHLISEMRRDAHPGSIQSIPSNAGNQNVVPMGSLSVLRNRRTLNDFRQLVAIYLLVIRQVFWIQKETPRQDNEWEKKLWEFLEEISPLEEDRPLNREMERIQNFLYNIHPRDLTHSFSYTAKRHPR